MRLAAVFLVLAISPARDHSACGQSPVGQSKAIEFNRDIRPILSDACFLCHGPAKGARKGGLRFDNSEGAFADLGGYKAIVPGSLNDSRMWQRINEKDPEKQMPPPKSGRKLLAKQIELLGLWIEQGAKWESHWGFNPPKRPPLPVVKNADWCKNPVDRFVLARLEREGLQGAAEATKETMIRRVTLDLTGLPPTISEIDAFLRDTSPGAYEKVVERLLASPRYGERMVLEWLDSARYADSNGYQTDGARAMWPWRDWVIDALNKNMPFDQFTIEQIAGDMLPNPTVAQKVATGFHRNHMLNGEGGRIAEESRVDYVVDRVDTTFTVWLGLTAGCARCHDHKYDPLPQKEYYQLYAYFNQIAESGGVDRRNNTAAPVIELPTEEQSKKIEDAREKLHRLIGDYFLGRIAKDADVKKAFKSAKKELTDAQNAVVITMIMEERKEPRETFVLVRGLYNKYADKVGAGIPKSLPHLPKGAPNNRLGFAKWLVDRDNPLTARVIVNRYWQMFFGAGLVKTSEDFGAQGETPSHPELLDWMASEFMAPSPQPSPPRGEGGPHAWDVKAMHRLIVTSAAYRQSTRVGPAILEKDPDNRLLTRGPRSRLNAFLLRDQALALSGLLVEKMGGPPVRPYQPPGIWEDFSFNQIRYTQDKGEKLYRRSLYTFWRRSIGPPNMFDTAARQVCTVRQPRTNTPLHALTLLNDVTYVEAARVWAQRLMKEGGKTPVQRLHLAFRMVTARQPTAAEQTVLLRGFERALAQYQNDREGALKLVSTGEYPRDAHLDVAELAAYTAVTSMILNLDEALTKE
ncbi:MAG: PSD1 domain-containing protein [Planctomycetes bacterium]|nr:PSD1 domain-containing protein [Planctomycetota bacterium]